MRIYEVQVNYQTSAVAKHYSSLTIILLNLTSKPLASASASGMTGQKLVPTSGYATWFTVGGAIRIAHYDDIDDVITRKL